MKRVLLAAFAVFLLLTVAAVTAQEHHMRMAGDPTEAIAAHAAKIAQTLQLTPDQKVQFDSIHTELAATVKPLFDQSRAAHDQLHALLDSSNPDAAAVGAQAIAAHGLEKQIEAAHKAALQKFEATLTPDQKAKFEGMMSEHMGGAMHTMAAPCTSHQ